MKYGIVKKKRTIKLASSVMVAKASKMGDESKNLLLVPYFASKSGNFSLNMCPIAPKIWSSNHMV